MMDTMQWWGVQKWREWCRGRDGAGGEERERERRRREDGIERMRDIYREREAE